MIKKLRQIWRDHRAMQAIRSNHGDIYLVSCSGQEGTVWECYVNQIDAPAVRFGPENAIIRAFEMLDDGTIDEFESKSVLLTNMGDAARKLIR